jgi:hypothetical protein
MNTSMKGCVERCAGSDGARRVPALLDRIVAVPEAHARFVNTLSRLEYVGVRKMLKSRRAEALDLEGLQHALDETIHALRLKKIAVALSTREPGAVDTYGDAHTLAGDAGEAYIQGLDAAAADAVAAAGVPEARRAEANYRLTSAAIEVRAQVFYPAYERCLRARGAGHSVAPILRDEDRHLDEMTAGLEEWSLSVEPLLAIEERLFARFLDAVERAAPMPGASPRAAVDFDLAQDEDRLP